MDARAGKDPTRTYYLRAKMRGEGERRWTLMARTIRQALIDHDLLGLRGIGRLPHGDKTEGFAAWLREELRVKVFGGDGGWLKPYIQQAAAIAQKRAQALVPGGVADPSRVTVMQTIAASELRGIVEAAQQQITRAVTHAMLANKKPVQAANAATAVIATMRHRTNAMSEWLIAKTHATVTLSAFGDAGVRRVGIEPERLRKRRVVPRVRDGDQPGHPFRGNQYTQISMEVSELKTALPRSEASEEKVAHYRAMLRAGERTKPIHVVSVGGQFEVVEGQHRYWAHVEEGKSHIEGKVYNSRLEAFKEGIKDAHTGKLTHMEAGYHEGHGETGSHCGICRFFHGRDKCDKVEAPIDPDDGCEFFTPRTVGDGKFLDADDDEQVDVITAGDNDVCEECEDISESGPYSLEEAEGLIPAHPNCRCAFVPAGTLDDAAPTAEAAGVIFKTPTGHMLLMKRADTGEWSIPAGHLEENETPRHAMHRESAEETGNPGNHRAYKVHEQVTRGVRFHTYVQPAEWQFEPILNPEHTQHGWFKPPDMPEPLHPGLVAALHTMTEGGGAALGDYNPDEPRAPAGSPEGGQWTSGGGGAAGGGAKGEHPGPGYSTAAVVKNGVIHTSSVYDAQLALFENRKVELSQPKQVSTLIKLLGKTAADMEKHGDKAPVFNLCNVSIAGTNLFCAESKGIPRVQMPVIPAKQTKDFINYLRDQGYGVEKGKEYAANLRATQNEIDGAKVAKSMARIKEEGFYKRLVISKDDYILDGHHTWAGQLGVDAKDNNLHDDKDVKIARINIPIIKLLAEAEKWTGGKGKKAAGQDAAFDFSLVWATDWAHLTDYNPYHEPAGSSEGGQFASAGEGHEQPAYHGTTREIEKFSKLGEPDESYQPDRMLGYHFAKDPAISNAFVMQRINEEERDAKEHGRVIPVTIPADRYMLQVPQPQYEWAKGKPITNNNIASDEVQVAKMIASEAYPSRPDILANFLEVARRVPAEQAQAAAKDLVAGKTVDLPIDGKYNLDKLINSFTGAFPYDKELKKELVRTARESWQKKGYKGLKYINTSPMETMASAGVKDPTSYIVFNPKDVKGRFTGDWRPLADWATLFLADSLTLDQAILDEGVGHPFRGNQYKEGESGGGKDKKVFSGQQVNTRTKLSKLETDKLGERVVLDYMRANGIKDARSANVKGNNYPVDIVGDHLAIELKSGLVSNGPSAQHWRATIGQPSKTEAAWLAKASAGAKAAHNEEKAQAIIDRKNAAVRELAKATGTKLAGMTVAVIINPDTKAMDLYAFKGFHARIGWKSDQAKAGFVKTIKYKGSR